MDSSLTALDVAPDASNHKDKGPQPESLANVLALLDEDRSLQLVQRAIPATTYTGPFEVVGRAYGLDPPTELCSPCKRLIQRPPTIYSWDDLVNSMPLPSAQFWVSHHDTLFQLVDCCFSRIGNCRLCQLFWHGIRRATKWRRSGKDQKQTFGWYDDSGLKVSLRKGTGNDFCICLNIPLQPRIGLSKLFFVRMLRNRRNNAMELRPTMAETTDSASTYYQIQKWINNCRKKHILCQIPESSQAERPTRLIRLDHSAGVFQLITEVTADTRYAALSYRWGTGKEYYILTEKSAKGMREGVSMGVLPKTILDTFTIARRLDLKYIWLDRLCIFQDSREDWSREASRMAFVYKYAFLTISASCASHESQGCFRKRNAAGIQPLQLMSNPLLPYNPTADRRESSYIFSDEPHWNQKDGGKLGHLLDRGWVFQERNLSQRIVHFAEEQVHWECRELEASETWPEPKGHIFTADRPSVVYGPSDDRSTTHSLWHRVVQNYSAREFTYDGDRLPALSGLARETVKLRRNSNEEYLAGLWRSTILLDLCWMGQVGRARIPEHYIAPSWSWASLHSRVYYDVGFRGYRYSGDKEAEFKDFRLRFEAADSYGAVNDGWIHLFGHLKPVTVIQVGVPEVEYWTPRVRCADGSPLPSVESSNGHLDVEVLAAGEKYSGLIYCLPLVKDRDDNKMDQLTVLYCLLLVPNGSIRYARSCEALSPPMTQDADEYQRAGLACINVKNWRAFKSWLEESPERDIIIR